MRFTREQISAAVKTATIPRWVDEGGLSPVEPEVFYARAVKKDSGEAVSHGPVSLSSALDKATVWFGSNDYRSVRVDGTRDGGKTWRRI